jgi:hypothetical protein
LRKPSMTNTDSAPPPDKMGETTIVSTSDFRRLQEDLQRSTVRLAQLEARLAEAERGMTRVAGDVETIVRTRSWRAVHAVAGALRAPFARKRR